MVSVVGLENSPASCSSVIATRDIRKTRWLSGRTLTRPRLFTASCCLALNVEQGLRISRSPEQGPAATTGPWRPLAMGHPCFECRRPWAPCRRGAEGLPRRDCPSEPPFMLLFPSQLGRRCFFCHGRRVPLRQVSYELGPQSGRGIGCSTPSIIMGLCLASRLWG